MHCECEHCDINNAFYGAIKDASVERFCEARMEFHVPAGKKFINQGDEIRNFKYLKEGLIKLHRIDSNAREQIISFGRPMDFISIQNFFSEKYYNYSATALENSVVCQFDMKVINELIRTNGEFAQKMIQISSMALNKTINTGLDLIRKTMYGKIAGIILFFSNEIYKSTEFDLPVSRKEIGQFTGLSIETVIRVISEFRKDGIIKVYGKKIEIIDKQRLTAIIEHS